MDSCKQQWKQSPEKTANFISKLYFCWTLPFFKFGYRSHLKIKDIFNATDDDVSGRLGDDLERNWMEEVNASKNNEKRRPNLQWAIFKTFYKTYSVLGIFLFFHCMVIRMLQPIVLAEYIRYFDSSEDEADPMQGWLLGGGVVFLAFMNKLVTHYTNLRSQRIGMRVRIASSSLIYRKLLRLTQTSLAQTNTGQIVNLLSNDVQRFDNVATYLHYIWIMPLFFCLSSYIMYTNVGVAAIAGMLLIGIQAIPIQGYLSKLQGKLRYEIALRTDSRVKLMNEITSSIQVIKMYAWEKPFQKVVELSRKLEIDVISKTSYIKGFTTGMMVFSERLAVYVTLITYILIGNRLTGDVVFSLAQLFNIVQHYVAFMFPNALATYSEAKVSVDRIEQFLLMDEKTSEICWKPDSELKSGSVEVVKANASWLPNISTLVDIDLFVRPGTLCCVVGQIGAGKSSLLQLLLKELPLRNGSVNVSGSISYASQEPWLFMSSIRKNILFGKPYLKARYKDVVEVCSLETDFEALTYGDKTLIGERGVTVSGGQRARINLARAVYSEADIYLLDDPLSSVDTHVGKHLFEECIIKFLRNKTRILVTHQLQFLKQADMILIIKEVGENTTNW